jgi:hypothetical protein
MSHNRTVIDWKNDNAEERQTAVINAALERSSNVLTFEEMLDLHLDSMTDDEMDEYLDDLDDLTDINEAINRSES